MAGSAAVLGACGGGGADQAAPTTTTTTTSSRPADAEVEIVDFAYAPKEIHVTAGGTIRWTNRDAFRHTVTSGAVDGPENQPDGRFDEDLAEAGSEADVTFDEPGRFTYYCKQHNAMDGTVIVDPDNKER